MNCQNCQSALPELLLDPAASSNAAARAHLESCAPCRRELESLKATFALLDSWHAPEPSPYFDQKLAVRLREAQSEAPAGWFARLRASLRYNTGRQFRPAVAGAFALALLIGGGTLAGISGFPHATAPAAQASATINDLENLDKNQQALHTLDQLSQGDAASDDNTAVQPRS
jgi:hypothetical protein